MQHHNETSEDPGMRTAEVNQSKLDARRLPRAPGQIAKDACDAQKFSLSESCRESLRARAFQADSSRVQRFLGRCWQGRPFVLVGMKAEETEGVTYILSTGFLFKASP